MRVREVFDESRMPRWRGPLLCGMTPGYARDVAHMSRLTALLAVFTVGAAEAQTASGQGALILAGGADLAPAVRAKFVALAGGPEAEIVYIPTASSGIRLETGFEYIPSDSGPPAANTEAFASELAKYFGVRRVTVLHTRDRRVASSDSFLNV